MNNKIFKSISGSIFSAVCDNETSAIQLALGSVYPMLLLSGKFSTSYVMVFVMFSELR
jgi:hypothetical protein